MTQISWDSRVNHAVCVVKIRTLITPNCFVQMNAYMCTSVTLVLILTTRLDSRILQHFLVQPTAAVPKLENKESCMGALIACDVAASSASVLGCEGVLFEPGRQAQICLQLKVSRANCWSLPSCTRCPDGGPGSYSYACTSCGVVLADLGCGLGCCNCSLIDKQFSQGAFLFPRWRRAPHANVPAVPRWALREF